MSTLDQVIARFQQQSGGGGPTELELEIRFDSIDYNLFELLLVKMRGEHPAEHTRTLNAIRTDTTEDVNGRRTHEQYIREAKFVPGAARKDEYRTKARLIPPARLRSTPGAPGYRVTLSRETRLAEPFYEDKNTMRYRFKNRVSFTPKDAAGALAGWRLDMTIVRELSGSDVNSLPGVARDVFRLDEPRLQSPANLLESLSLAGDAVPTATRIANQQQYQYEVELEYMGAPAELTSAAVHRAAGAVLHLTNPTYMATAQMQSELHRVASLFIDVPVLLQRYLSGEWGLKQLTLPAVAPTRGQYADIYPPVGYYVTDKAHGVHALAIVDAGRLVLIAPGVVPPMREWQCAAADGAAEDATRAALTGAYTVVEGEVIDGANEGDLRFLAFDVLSSRGENLTSRPFEERHRELGAATAAVAACCTAARAAPLGEELGAVSAGDAPPACLQVEVKPFLHLSSADPDALSAQFDEIYHRKGRTYDVDGLVLYGPGQPYSSTPVYKWKPFEEVSNDFLARRPPASVRGRYPFVDLPGHELYFLYVGISREMFRKFGMDYGPGYRDLFPAHVRSTQEDNAYFPIQFQPSDQPYAYLYQHPVGGDAAGTPAAGTPQTIENRIVELRLRTPEGADGTPRGDGEKPYPGPQWELMRVRTDRDEDLQKGRLFGNNFKTAELNWLIYRDPFPFEMLGTGPDGASYFSAHRSGIYTAPNAFVSYCKSALTEELLAGRDYLVDLGAGRGAEGARYINAGIRAAVMVDSDPEALAELVRRKYNWAKRKQQGRSAGTLFHVIRGDFTAPHAQLVSRVRGVPGFPDRGASGLVSFLAAHYAFGSRDGIVNFAMLVRELVAPGGVALLTLMDGARVVELHKTHKVRPGESWDSREGGALKFSVRRQYSQNTLTVAGQEIGVLLPFSNGEYYTEYLSNFDEIVKVFSARGFKLHSRRSLWEAYQAGFRSQRNHYNALTEGDREWLGLFGALVFERTEK